MVSRSGSSQLALVAALAVAALVVAAEPAAAQRFYFNPEFRVEVRYTENPFFRQVGETDTVGRFVVVLPVRREFRLGGSIEGVYSPAIEQYRRSDDLDNISHRFRLNFVARTAPHTDLSLFAAYTRAQEQARLRSVEDIDLFLGPRLDREIYRAGVNYARRLSERWTLGLSASYLKYEFETIEGVSPSGFDFGTLDRSGYRGRATGAYDVTRNTRIGLSYGWERYTFGGGGEETTQLASFTLRHAFSERLELDLEIGAFTTSGRDARGRDISRNGAYGAIAVTQGFRRVSLRLFARHRPSPGGALPGPSTDTVLGLMLSKAHVRRWGWELVARYGQRDSIDPALETLESWAYGGRIEYFIRRIFSVRLEGVYTDQSGPPAFEVEYWRVGLSAVWTPLGRTRLGGGAEAVPTFEGE